VRKKPAEPKREYSPVKEPSPEKTARRPAASPIKEEAPTSYN